MTTPPTPPRSNAAEERPTEYFTELGTMDDGTPIIVAWANCRCGQHVVNCLCPNGPTEPARIQRMRENEMKHAAEAAGLPYLGPGSTIKASAPAGDLGIEPIADPAAAAVATNARSHPGIQTVTCVLCRSSVPITESDKNDDGTSTCFSCQEGGSNVVRP